jgi:hypothetical protein
MDGPPTPALEGKGQVEGRWAVRTVGLDDVGSVVTQEGE